MTLQQKVVRYLIWLGLACAVAIPLFVDSDLFFPYITTKTFIFKIAVELTLLLWFYYLVIYKEARFVIGWPIMIFAMYLVVMIISSMLGGDLYYSMWGQVERSEGLVLWFHMFAFLVLLRNMIVTKEQWYVLFDFFFGIAQIIAVIGLLQFFGVSFINISSGGARIASTIGNAAFLAGYLLFVMFIGLYLSTIRKTIGLRLYYWIAVVLDIFIILQTGTRGAYLALIVAIVGLTLFNAIKSPIKKIRYSLITILFLFVAGFTLLYVNKDAPLFRHNYAINRITSISLSDRTAQTRILTWQSAWKGFLEKPLIGYGQENFYLVFNKYFNPEIFEDPGSRVWFDRAHNIFIDHLITGGIIGFGLYVWIIIYSPWLLLSRRIMVRREKIRNKLGYTKHLGYQFMFWAVITFIVQGLFVFETLPTYIGHFLLLAFTSHVMSRKFITVPRFGIVVMSIVYVLAFIPALYYFNIREFRGNQQVLEAIRLQQVNPAAAVNAFTRSLALDSSGKQEFRKIFTQYVMALIAEQQIAPEAALPIIAKVDAELQSRIDDKPEDVNNLLLAMEYYNHTHIFDTRRLDRVDQIGDLALQYSPNRPQLYYQLGYADFYRAEALLKSGDRAAAEPYIDNMIEDFETAIKLNNDVTGSYINALMSLLALGKSELIQSYFDRMDVLGVHYRQVQHLERIVNSAIAAKDYTWAAMLYQWLIELDKNNPQYYISLALAYFGQGDNDKAIEAAEAVKKFGGEYIVQSDEFVRRLHDGTFVIPE